MDEFVKILNAIYMDGTHIFSQYFVPYNEKSEFLSRRLYGIFKQN